MNNNSNINTVINKTPNKSGTINNYQPELNKKNNFNTSTNINVLNNRTNTNQNNKQGPIKIQNEYDRKPSTPDNIIQGINNISTIK